MNGSFTLWTFPVLFRFFKYPICTDWTQNSVFFLSPGVVSHPCPGLTGRVLFIILVPPMTMLLKIKRFFQPDLPFLKVFPPLWLFIFVILIVTDLSSKKWMT